MKKILEVLQYGENDIRFNTDFSEKHPEEIPEIISKVAFTMMSKLWGGNETAVIAMIRALAIADLSVCADRKRMIREFDRESENFAKILTMAINEFKKNGGKAVLFTPDIAPPKAKS